MSADFWRRNIFDLAEFGDRFLLMKKFKNFYYFFEINISANIVETIYKSISTFKSQITHFKRLFSKIYNYILLYKRTFADVNYV
jgi:hypothetical protein